MITPDRIHPLRRIIDRTYPLGNFLGYLTNRFRTVARWTEYSDPYGYGEEHARVWHVAVCRACGLATRSTNPIDVVLFDAEHTQHPHDTTEVKAS